LAHFGLAYFGLAQHIAVHRNAPQRTNGRNQFLRKRRTPTVFYREYIADIQHFNYLLNLIVYKMEIVKCASCLFCGNFASKKKLMIEK